MRKLVFLMLLLSARFAFAQSSATLNRFAAAETTSDDFHLSRPVDYGHLRFGSQLHIDYANDPLVYESTRGDASSESLSVVSDELRLNLGLALGLFDRVVIYAGVPFVGYMNGASQAELDALGAGVAQHDDGGFGDVYLGARVRLLGDQASAAALALQVTGTFPTAGSAQVYLGDAFLSVHPEVLAEFHPVSDVRLVVNLGARFRENTNPGGDLFFGDDLTFGLGVGATVWGEVDAAHLDLIGQVYGSSEFEHFFERGATPLEALAGLKFFTAGSLVFGLSGGPGLARGFGSPDFRVVGMLGASTGGSEASEVVVVDTDGDGLADDADACPAQAEDADGFEDGDGCPDSDNDGDGVADAEDACPMEPEDLDSFEDTNGCPDPDNDGDGIADASDACPNAAEDADGFEDQDGCADPDNDGDGILDGSDQCVNEPGPAVTGGCPDPDRDGDTVPDRLDNCPDEAGAPENQGCQAAQQVRIENGRLEILDIVYFRTNSHVIQSRSFPLLRNVAAVLGAHPELTLIRIEGHTDSRGNHDRNVTLSQRRAESVKAFLAREGVEEGRLTAAGFGPDRPIVPNASSAEITPAIDAWNLTSVR